MGVDLYVLDFLLKLRGHALGATLWLGRQGWHVENAEPASQVLQRYDPDATLDGLLATTGYSERLFQYLGSSSIQSMDNSDYEGAEIIHDLNTVVPQHWHESFDCIFDGGTIEHVFNVPVALDNVKRMLRPGGLFLTVNGANNFLGHGLYQFSPELLWRVFEASKGFEVERLQLAPVAGMPEGEDVIDSVKAGKRQEVRSTLHSTYLMAAIRRTWQPLTDDNGVQQSDYRATWEQNKQKATERE